MLDKIIGHKNNFTLLIMSAFLFLFSEKSTHGAVVTFGSPTPKVGSLYDFVVAILQIVVKIGIPVLAIAFIYSGFLFVTAQGNEAELKKAKSAFVGTVIGATAVLCAVLLATVIKNTIGELGG